ncbi:MAG: NAD(P)/FAD-dependent oxidoreductase [Sulfurimonadaceae bacterium]
MNQKFDVMIIGAGAAGIMASISAALENKKVLLLEKMPKIATKLKATGGGRCNLTNTLPQDEFMRKFGKHGRFMSDALKRFTAEDLRDFFQTIGVQSHAPDGFRVFPITHNSSTILEALDKELRRLNIEVLCEVNITEISKENDVFIVQTADTNFTAEHLIIATGGLGYPTLGATGEGYTFAQNFGHTVTSLHPAMMPLITKEKWVASCKANTIAAATLKVNLPQHKKLKATGDLIFTKEGIRGPVVLDFARELTPILDAQGEVPLLVNLTKGLNEEQIFTYLKTCLSQNPTQTVLELISTLLPTSVAQELCNMCDIPFEDRFKNLEGIKREKLVKYLAWTPLTVVGHEGFKNAMITRGGIALKELNPKTMESKRVSGLYFCGEIVDLDGPCGGYNLQWSFSSGFLAGKLGKSDD